MILKVQILTIIFSLLYGKPIFDWTNRQAVQSKI